MSYLRFPINLWMQTVTGCTPGPSNHSTLRARPAPRALHARSTPESILDFLKPFFDFVDKAVDSGGSVLVHCVAGAHRAGTAGCLLLMHYHQLAAKVRVDTVMPMPPPHGALTCTCTCGCARAGGHRVHAKLATSDRAEGCAAAAAHALRASRWCGVGCGCDRELRAIIPYLINMVHPNAPRPTRQTQCRHGHGIDRWPLVVRVHVR